MRKDFPRRESLLDCHLTLPVDTAQGAGGERRDDSVPQGEAFVLVSGKGLSLKYALDVLAWGHTGEDGLRGADLGALPEPPLFQADKMSHDPQNALTGMQSGVRKGLRNLPLRCICFGERRAACPAGSPLPPSQRPLNFICAPSETS